jgi:hypothetical protein
VKLILNSIGLDWFGLFSVLHYRNPFLSFCLLPSLPRSKLRVPIPAVSIVVVVVVAAVLLWICSCGCVVRPRTGREEGHCAEIDVGEVFSLLGLLLLVLWVSLLVSLLLLMAVIVIGVGGGR